MPFVTFRSQGQWLLVRYVLNLPGGRSWNVGWRRNPLRFFCHVRRGLGSQWQPWFAWRPVNSMTPYGRDPCLIWLSPCWRRCVQGRWQYTHHPPFAPPGEGV